jgi:hypothetical protein
MTTATRQAPPSPAQIERATALAARMLEDRGLGKRLPTAAAAIGRALVATAPGSEHGQLLTRVLRPAAGERADEEQAAIWLACRSEIPSAAAVAAAARQLAKRRARQDRLIALAAPHVGADGERAAAFVAGIVQETGAGPTWAELGDAMGWPAHPLGLRTAIITGLRSAGWLRYRQKPRSLRPGPMAGK